MTYDVVEQNGSGYQATVLGWPSCSSAGGSREEALEKLRGLVETRLENAQIVKLEIGAPVEHPWLKLAGTFKDNPLFDEVQEKIEAYRRDLDAAEEDL